MSWAAGGTAIKTAFLGSTALTGLYVGAEKVWPTIRPPMPGVSAPADGVIVGTVVGNAATPGALGLSVAADGSVWVAGYSANVVYQIVSGVVVATLAVGSEPYDAGVATDGSIYVPNSVSGTVSHIVKGVKVADIPVGKFPRYVVEASDGSVFVSNEASGTISHIVGDAVKETITGLNSPSGLSIAVDGSLWVPEIYANDVAHVVAGVVVGRVAVGTSPIFSAASSDGSIWVSNRDTGTVSHIVNNVVAETITLKTGDQPHGIYVSPNGKAVYVCARAAGVVVKIQGGVQTRIPVPTAPYGITAGPDGTVYVACLGGTVAIIV